MGSEFAEAALSILERCGNEVKRETQRLTRAEKIEALKNKIEALEFAALEPKLEPMGGGGHQQMMVRDTNRIEECAEEALALVDKLFREADSVPA